MKIANTSLERSATLGFIRN